MTSLEGCDYAGCETWSHRSVWPTSPGRLFSCGEQSVSVRPDIQ